MTNVLVPLSPVGLGLGLSGLDVHLETTRKGLEMSAAPASLCLDLIA